MDQLRLIPYKLHGEGFCSDVFLLNWLEFRATFILCKNDISLKPICPSFFSNLAHVFAIFARYNKNILIPKHSLTSFEVICFKRLQIEPALRLLMLLW